MNTQFEYFPPNHAVTSAWGVQATCVGYLDTESREQYPPSDHPPEYGFNWDVGRILGEYQIHFILRGEGFLEVERKEKTFPIRPGSVFLISPGVWHRYLPSTQNGWCEYWLGLKGDRVSGLLQPFLQQWQTPILSPSDDAVMLRVFDSAIAGLTTRAERDALSASTAMMGLSMLPHLKPAPLDLSSDPVRLACCMLETNLHTHVSLEDIAAKLGVGYHSLRKKFAEQTGVSLHQYRLAQRIARAKVLLRSRRFSIEDVATQVGFSDPLYFSRFFKKRVGVPPTEFLGE